MSTSDDNPTNDDDGTIMDLLEYEKQIFFDAIYDDGLLIMARGLGVERIITNFLKVYADQSNLVFVLNAFSLDEEYFLEQLEKAGVSPLPKVINNEYTSAQRQGLYRDGGVLFITSRILTVDLLTDRVPVEKITGVIVLRAHKVVESGQEAFILRLYRQKNKTGFIKAFTQNATVFTAGYNNIERTMKNLYLRNLNLWPRFHANVTACMDKHTIDVVEINIPLTDSMMACQAALLDITNKCIKELKQCTSAIDSEEITVENAIGASFDQTIRYQLEPIWNQLGNKTKKLVADLKSIRQMMQELTQHDCVTFYNRVNSLRTSEKTFGNNTGWLFLESTDNLYLHARNRVYGDESKRKKTKTGSSVTDPLLEPCPKWDALQTVMDEITEHNNQSNGALGQGRVLIAAHDDRACSHIKEVLCYGSQCLLAKLFNKSLAEQGRPVVEEKKKHSKRKTKQTKSDEVTLTKMIGEDTGKSSETKRVCSSEDAYVSIVPDPVTIIHPLRGCSDPYSLVRTLEETAPRYVVLFDPDMEFVRQLEVYHASHPSIPLRVYFLMYTGSVEEQRYLTILRKEKEAFTCLIKDKATMVIPEEREGRIEEDPELARDLNPAAANTRKGGLGTNQLGTNRVVVDMREFRSELPSLIHRRGMEIVPVTIEVGDYILTPDICVERKSVSDLIGSLNNGRLYNQCVAMCRYYKRPVLLIEFDPAKSFSLHGKYQSNDITIQETTSRLTQLTMHFPKLRVLWCPSPYATAELFEELKAGREQPDASCAMTVSSNEETVDHSDRYSHSPQDMLLKMPGITSKNYRMIMNKVEDIATLCSLTEENLTRIMGNSQDAKSLWQFLHKEHVPKESTSSRPTRSGFTRPFNKRKK